jgi:hypothetical protein
MSAVTGRTAAPALSLKNRFGPKAIMIGASSISLHQRHINLRLRVSRWFCRSIGASADACKGENNAQTKAWQLSGCFY